MALRHKIKKYKKKVRRYGNDLRKHPQKMVALFFWVLVGLLVLTSGSLQAEKYMNHRALIRDQKQGFSQAKADIGDLVLDIQGSVLQEGTVRSGQRCDKSPPPVAGNKYVCEVNTELTFEADPQTAQNMVETIDGLIQTRGDTFRFEKYLKGPLTLAQDGSKTDTGETFTHVGSNLNCSAEYMSQTATDGNGLLSLTVNLACSGPAAAKYF